MNNDSLFQACEHLSGATKLVEHEIIYDYEGDVTDYEREAIERALSLVEKIKAIHDDLRRFMRVRAKYTDNAGTRRSISTRNSHLIHKRELSRT